MLEEERALMHLLREDAVPLPAGAWERVQSRLTKRTTLRERIDTWLWWHHRTLALGRRWAAGVAVLMLAVWTWYYLPRIQQPSEADMLTSYIRTVTYAQSTAVDDPIGENTRFILSAWRD